MLYLLQMSVPSWVVALRHSATHVTMPSLTLLKSAAEFALKWLKENYWEKQIALISIGNLYSNNLYSNEDKNLFKKFLYRKMYCEYIMKILLENALIIIKAVFHLAPLRDTSIEALTFIKMKLKQHWENVSEVFKSMPVPNRAGMYILFVT